MTLPHTVTPLSWPGWKPAAWRVRPVIAPAFYWDFSPASPVTSLGRAMICSNLDRLEVYVGGQHFASLTPDAGDYAALAYPPSFADFRGVDGSSRPDLRIDGYLGPDLIASRSLASDPSFDRLALAFDDAEIAGDGVEIAGDGVGATRLVFRAVDRYGAPRPYVTGGLALSVAGPAVLLGDNPFDLGAAGGACAVWIRSRPGAAGTVAVSARRPVLGPASAAARVRPGGRRPASRARRAGPSPAGPPASRRPRRCPGAGRRARRSGPARWRW